MVKVMEMINEFMSMPITIKSIIASLCLVGMLSVWFWGFIEFMNYIIQKGGKNV